MHLYKFKYKTCFEKLADFKSTSRKKIHLKKTCVNYKTLGKCVM